MSTTSTRLTFDEFLKLPEREGTHYELDEGELVMEPSPTFLHNRIRDRIANRLSQFVKAHRLGEVIVEMDFRLGPDTVRNPDVAFVTAQHLQTIDVNRSPVDGAPALAVEVVSPSNLAQDMAKKVSQYLSAGTSVVWVVHPVLQQVEVHSSNGARRVKAPELLVEEHLFAGHQFSLFLAELFSTDPYS
jgi:Uma2 family endonuclease